MKTETIVKVLNRYCKGLEVMMQQAISDNELIDASNYQFDLNALKQAKIIIENGKE